MARRPDRRKKNEPSKVHGKVYKTAYGTTHETERGIIVKEWTGRVPVCVTYPNTYFIGMSNLAIHLLYKTLNVLPGVVCERAFFEEAKLGSGPRSIESRKPLNAFELIFITFSFEMDYINAANLLSLAHLGPLARERKEDDPLVIGGGICVMANPEPLAGLFDLFIMGDIEATIPAFIETYVAHREKGRGELIEELSKPEWVYNPGHLTVSYGKDGTVAGFDPASFRVRIERYRGKHLSTSAIMTEQTEFSNMFLVEGTRGCPSRCPFCLTGAIGPFVYDRLPSIDESVQDVGIIGGGVSFHPALVDLIKELRARKIRPHLPSLRMDEVSLEVIELVSEEVKTLTFGIEAAAERLRRSIGKPLTDQDIYERIEAIMAWAPSSVSSAPSAATPRNKPSASIQMRTLGRWTSLAMDDYLRSSPARRDTPIVAVRGPLPERAGEDLRGRTHSQGRSGTWSGRSTFVCAGPGDGTLGRPISLALS